RARTQEPDRRHLARLLRARRNRPSGYTAAEKCDEFPPPHGAYPKAKDHKLIIAPCIAAKSGHSFPSWVINGRGGRSHTSAHVRFTLKADKRRLASICPLSARSGCEQPQQEQSRYSITSSARASTDDGISSPRALAVFRLITSSYFVGACTGRS